jgi:hypothetical protein
MTSAAGQSDLTSRPRRCFAEDGYLLLRSQATIIRPSQR